MSSRALIRRIIIYPFDTMLSLSRKKGFRLRFDLSLCYPSFHPLDLFKYEKNVKKQVHHP